MGGQCGEFKSEREFSTHEPTSMLGGLVLAHGWPQMRFMALGTLREHCAEPAKGTFLESNRTTISALGPESLRSPAQRRRSHVISIQVHGNVFPLVRAPKAHGFMTGPTANSPISMPTNITRRSQVFGPVAY